MIRRIFPLIPALAACCVLSGCFFGLFGFEKSASQSEADPAYASAIEQKKKKKDGEPAPPERQSLIGNAAEQPLPAPSTAAPATAPQDDLDIRLADETPAAPPPPSAETQSPAPAPVSLAPGSAKPDDELAVIETKFGRIVIQLDRELAPRHTENFKKNIRIKIYDGTTFHRVVPGFLIQGGDPNTKDDDRANDGLGGTGYTVALEKKLPHRRGSVAMARQGDRVNKDRRSNGAQFYICLVDSPFLDGKYSVFGKVVGGMDVVDRIAAAPRDEKDNPRDRIEIQTSLVKASELMR